MATSSYVGIDVSKDRLDVAGTRVAVDATDNVEVTRVVITILDEQGQTLEQGEAALIPNGQWEFTPTVLPHGNMVVEAFNLAGNTTRHATQKESWRRSN